MQKVLPFKILMLIVQNNLCNLRGVTHPMSNTRRRGGRQERGTTLPPKVTTEMSQLITNTIYRSGIRTTAQFQERKGREDDIWGETLQPRRERRRTCRGSNATSKTKINKPQAEMRKGKRVHFSVKKGNVSMSSNKKTRQICKHAHGARAGFLQEPTRHHGCL